MENFCKYFAEDKPRYTLDEIATKREKVIEMVEKKVESALLSPILGRDTGTDDGDYR